VTTTGRELTSGRVTALTPPGKAMFDWAVLFAALALVFPEAGLVGVVFAIQSRRKGYGRWRSALVMSLWCAFLGCLLRCMLRLPMVP
jgi:hypothetical protein